MGVLPDWMIEQQVKIVPFDRGLENKGKVSGGLTSYGYDARVGYIFKVFSPINATVIDPKAFNPNALVTVDLTPKYNHKWDAPLGASKCLVCGAWRGTPSEIKTQCPDPKPDHILIPPNSFALAETVEYFEIPRDVLAFVVGKSTYARCGIIVPVTPLEPEWKGKVTVEISNTTCLPAKVYCGEGIMQIVFIRTDMSVLHGKDIRYISKALNGLVPSVPDFSEKLADLEVADQTCRVSYADKGGRYQDQKGLTTPFVEE